MSLAASIIALIVVLNGQKDAERQRDRLEQNQIAQSRRDAAEQQRDQDIDAALRELARRVAAHDAKPYPRPVVIIRGGSDPDSREVIVVQQTPTPQPTATVTCNPTPIIGNCRR